MIYVFGDVHRTEDIEKLFEENFCEQKSMSKDDYVIIAGDFGLVWKKDDMYKRLVNWFGERNFTTLFVDGNHENFEWLYQFPIVERFGAKVGKISNSIYHLRRGEIYTIDGKNIFTFGGARSIDNFVKIDRVTWWEEEMPNYREMTYGISNLQANNFKVDYIITHTCPLSIMRKIIKPKGLTALEKYFEHIKALLDINNIEYKWYFGHLHKDVSLGDFVCSYNEYHLIE